MIREIDSNRHITAEYVNLNISMPSYYDVDDRPIETLCKYMTFVINNLKTKMFININIFIFKDIDFIIFTRISHIDNYDIIFQFTMNSLIRSFIK